MSVTFPGLHTDMITVQLLSGESMPGALSKVGHISRTRLQNSWLANGPIQALAVGFAAALVCLPFTRTVFWLGDEGILLDGAERMLHGDHLYADFFEFLPPGGFLITEVWLRAFGASLLSARLLAIVTIAGIASLTYLTCLRVSKNVVSSALIVFAWVVISQGVWTQINHHWFTTLLSMAAFYTSLVYAQTNSSKMRDAFMVGLAVGAAGMVTPTQGALVLMASAITCWDIGRDRAWLRPLVWGCAVVPLVMLGYVIWHSSLVFAFRDVLGFTGTRYTAIQYVPFASGSTSQTVALKYLFPVVAALTALVCALRQRTALTDRTFRSSVAFGLAGFIGCFPRPDIIHIGFVAPLVLPLFVYCVAQIAGSWRLTIRIVELVAAGCLLALPFRQFWWQIKKSFHTPVSHTPAGDVVFFDQPGPARLVAQIRNIPAKDSIFFYPYLPMLPFLTARSQQSGYDVFVPEYTTPKQYGDACISVMRSASWVVVDRTWTDPASLKQFFPAMKDASPQEVSRFDLAIHRGFMVVSQFGSFIVWHRTPAANEKLCEHIADSDT